MHQLPGDNEPGGKIYKEEIICEKPPTFTVRFLGGSVLVPGASETAEIALIFALVIIESSSTRPTPHTEECWGYFN